MTTCVRALVGSGGGVKRRSGWGSALTALTIIAVTIAAPRVAGASFAVTIVDFAFVPSTSTIAPGDQITWTNSGNATHSVTWTRVRVGSTDVPPGASHMETFATVGSFTYQCRFHPSLMQGTVQVVGPLQTTTPSPTAAPTPAPSPAPTPSPTPSPTTAPTPSPTPSPTPPTTPRPSPTPAASPSPTTPPLTGGASGTNLALGIALIVAGIGVLGATLWWRFGRSG